jgi:hypothetical protein
MAMPRTAGPGLRLCSTQVRCRGQQLQAPNHLSDHSLSAHIRMITMSKCSHLAYHSRRPEVSSRSALRRSPPGHSCCRQHTTF